MSRRLLLALAVVATAVMTDASPAGAHGGAVVSTDYRTRIAGVSPEVPGLRVHLVEAGGRVELTNRTGDELVVLGYEGEPYLRIGRRGVFENRRSPAVYLNANRTGGEPVPADATADADPRWVQIGDGPTARWHDHRLHWMAADPEEVRAHPRRRHVVAEWALPLQLAGEPVTVTGDIVYEPGPPVWPWLAGAASIALVAFALTRRRWLATAVVVLVIGDVARVAGLTFVLVGSAGDLFRQAVDVGTLSAVGWGLGVVAVVRLRGGHPDGHMAAGLVGLLLAIAGGVLEWDDLGRSQLAFAFPADLARICVTVITGVGVGVAVAALERTARHGRAGPETAAGRVPSFSSPRPPL